MDNTTAAPVQKLHIERATALLKWGGDIFYRSFSQKNVQYYVMKITVVWDMMPLI
jgi:hypothetical protein